MNLKILKSVFPLLLLVSLLGVSSVRAQSGPTVFCSPTNGIYRVSLTAQGLSPIADSAYPNFSADGRYVGFYSDASLVPGDGDAFADVYIYDRQTCELELISVSSTGAKGNSTSYGARMSADGRYVVYQSTATNLVTGDTNSLSDVFLYDRQTATTTQVSVSSAGVQGDSFSGYPDISADGRFIAFASNSTNLTAGDTNGDFDVFVHNQNNGNTFRVSVTNAGGQAIGDSLYPVISSDGRYVAFHSEASNLVAGDTNSRDDIFLRDRQANTTTRVSVATGGAQSNNYSYRPQISSDGNFIAFESDAGNLVTGDTNGYSDIFVHERITGTTTRVSVMTGGVQTTDDASRAADISDNGRYVVFESLSAELVTGDTNATTDVFVHDRTTGTTTRVSVGIGGAQITGEGAYNPTISGDGRFISFDSDADNLVLNDTNGFIDTFVTPLALNPDDTLALFNPPFNQVNLIDTLTDNPAYTAHSRFSAYAPVSGGQWVMGDWNGDGLKTPGIYANGPFYYTNVMGESLVSDWRSLWIGVAGAPVAGQFDDALPNDCIGAVQSANFPPYGLAFVLYYTCDLSGTAAPTISNQWLSVVLPDSGGFTGTHQFAAGDFDNDGDDSVAVRRGTTIAFGNVAPVDGSAAFDLAQYIGAPGTGSDGIIVTGDWDANGIDSFGLFYQNGEFYYRNDLLFNSGVYVNQTVGIPFGTLGIQATSWR